MLFTSTPWRTQPPQMAGLDRTNSLCIGLESALLMSVSGYDVPRKRIPTKDAAAVFVGSPYGMALRSAGTAEGLDITASGGLENLVAVGLPLTVMMLVRINSTGSRRIIVGDYDVSGLNESIAFDQQAAGTYRLYIVDIGGSKIITGGTVSTGWKWLELVHTPGGTVEAFVDGVSLGTTASSGNRIAGTDLRVGRPGAYTSVGFDGDIAASFIWSRALNGAQRASVRAKPYQMFSAPRISGEVMSTGSSAGTVAITGSASTSAAGTAVAARFVALRSRKNPTSTATFPLTGQVVTWSQGSLRTKLTVDLQGITSTFGQGVVRSDQVNTNNPPLLISPIPDLQLPQGSTYSVADFFSDPGDTLTYSLAQGALPAGVTFGQDGLFSAAASAALGLAGSFVVKADDGHSVVNDPKPFKLYRGGVQIREAAALLTLVNPDEGGTAISGDTVKVAPGTYSPAAFDWYAPSSTGVFGIHGDPTPGTGKCDVELATLTIEWLVPGQRPVIDHSIVGAISGPSFFIGMGYTCTNLTVRGLDVRGSYQASNNQSCFIYGYSGLNGTERGVNAIPYTLTVEDCAMRDFTFGIQLSANWNGVFTMRRCLIEAGLGGGTAPTLPHGVYIGDLKQVNVTGCLFRRMNGRQADAGHLLKIRAREANIYANFFDGRNAGIARCLGYENGGQLSLTGNIFMHGEADSNVDSNGPIAFGLEQIFPNAGMVYDDRVHSIYAAQNTIWWNQANGFGQKLLRRRDYAGSLSTPPADLWAQGTFALISAPYVAGNNHGNARSVTATTIQLAVDAPTMVAGQIILLRSISTPCIVTTFDDATKIATFGGGLNPVPDQSIAYELASAPALVGITVTVRNNIAAALLNGPTFGAQEFVATYPDNSQVDPAYISPDGTLLIAPIPGNPAVRDATLEFAAEFQEPRPRTDTNRGGRP